MTNKPVLAISLGDPAGVGPEVILKALQDPKIYHACRPLVVGNAQSFSRLKSVRAKIRPILNPAQALFRHGVLEVLHIPYKKFTKICVGQPDASSGEISFLCVEKTVELVMTNLAQGMVHAPISKSAWKWAGVPYPGHTELIAKLCGAKSFAMAIASGDIRTVMVTRHVPLARVSSILRKDEIVQAALLAGEWMKRIGLKRPRIGVCALNPHAGEGGLIGVDEIRTIAPAVSQAQRKADFQVSGPIPADSAFKEMKHGNLDCLVTLYHDQSLIPIKLFDESRAVNITLGLPFPRTSPAHGTAFDIAGKNSADPSPMKEAILACAKLC